MTQSRIMVCLLCLIISVGQAGAQNGQISETDQLKKKIEAVNFIHKRALWRQYEQYATSLEQYIADLEEVLKTLDETDADEIKKIKADIERLTREHAAAVEKARSLRPEVQEEQAVARPTPTPSAVAAQVPCDCPFGKDAEGRDVMGKLPAGVIWCGPAKKSELRVQTFAERAAPILWFSPNEPLMRESKLPEPLPGDKTSGPVVYYRITEVVLRQNDVRPEFDGPELELDKVKKLTLKYYFYYSKDAGFGEHLHDLESARLEINFTLWDKEGNKQVDRAKADYYVAHISKVSGAAHGVTWYANQLDIGDKQRDTSLPITLLVEEGKHASSPDRNADGFYSPGYDVNKRYTDAWGVRDLLGSGNLGSAKYEGSMTKPRRPEHMVKVKLTEPDPDQCLLRPYTGEHKTGLAKAQDGYTLKPARVFETTAQRTERFNNEKTQEKSRIGKILATDRIFGWMKDEKFGEMKDGEFVSPPDGNSIKPKMTGGAGFFKKALRKGFGIERDEEFKDSIPIAYRLEGRQHGFTILPPVGRYQVFFLDGYFLPKLNFMFPGTREGAIPGRKFERPVRFSLEAMYTPSASRTFDWYATGGAEWARPAQDLGYEGRFVQEGGLRFRFNQGSWLLGGRVGLRVTGFAEARSPRFIFEFGTGAF